MKKFIQTIIVVCLFFTTLAPTGARAEGAGIVWGPSAGTIYGGLVSTNYITASSVTITGNGGTYGLEVSSNVSLAGTLYTAGGNVGVGTATPVTKFNVVTSGASGNDGFRLQNITDNHMFLFRPSMAAGSNNGIVQAGDTGFIFTNGTVETGAFTIAPWSSATSGLRMNNLGNIGIGIALPTSRLHVAGDVLVTSSMNITGNGGIYGLTVSSNASIAGTLYTTAEKVGIGTNNPAAKLEISSTHTDPADDFSSGLNVTETVALTANNSHTAYGLKFSQYTTNTIYDLTGSLYGIQGWVVHTGSGTLSNAYGNFSAVRTGGSGGITNAYGYVARSGTSATSTGTITNLYQFHSGAPVRGGTGLITNAYGFYSGNMGSTGGTNAYGVYLEAQSGSTNNYAIYTAGANDKSYFGGNVGIGTTAPATKLHVSSGVVFVDGTGYGVGIGTSAPVATLGIVVPANNASDTHYALKISSANGVSIFGIHDNGHLSIYGVIPTLGTCNNGTMYATSRDTAMRISFTGSNSSCAIVFGQTFDATPVCVATGAVATATEGAIISTQSASGITIVPNTGAWDNGDALNIICLGIH